MAPTVLVLLDTTLTLLRRARRGESLTAAHREHVYQRLTTVPGSPVPAVVATVATVGLVATAALPVAWCLACWAVLAGAYVATPLIAARRHPVPS